MDARETMGATCEADEVVYETDVYISKSLSENLYLLHYPSKEIRALDSQEGCLSAKVKPKQQKLEIEFELDVHSSKYDKSRGEQMAINVDGLNPSGETFYKNSVMDKIAFSGVKAGLATESYFIGYIRKGEFHVSPIQSVIEMTQNLNYLDKGDSLAKKSFADEEEDENEEAVAVTVRFEGPNAEKDKQIRQKSYQYFKQQSASEPWIAINYHPYGSVRSISEFENFICSQMYRDVGSSGATSKDYLKELIPDRQLLAGSHTVKDADTVINEDHALSDQIKQLLVNAHVLRFSTILEKLPCDVETDSVERLVQQFAILVQGCWVVKSDLLYNEESVSPFTGFTGKHLINCRDYVVWLFTKSRHITRREVLSAIYIPNQDLEDMIRQIAINSDRGWEFRYPCDAEFIESHRSIEQSQDIKWNLRYKKLVKELNLGICDPDGLPPKLPCPVLPRPKQKRHSRSSISEGEESGTDSSTSGQKEVKSKRVYSPKKHMNASPSKHASKSKPYQIATLDVSPTFLETSPSDEVKAELKEYLEDVIRNQFIMTLGELKYVISDSHLSSLCNHSEFEKIVDEALLNCGAQKLKNIWPSHSAEEPLYAFTEYGNKLDRHRNVLLELFTKTARVRINLFKKSVEDELREIISENDCRQIFADYCIHKSGFYYLKGTISPDP